jgi:hypothetical protein
MRNFVIITVQLKIEAINSESRTSRPGSVDCSNAKIRLSAPLAARMVRR